MINALSSGATGIGLVLFASPIAILFGLENTTAVSEVGIFLVVFALLAFWESRRIHQNEKMVKFIIALDIVWVVLSLITIALQLFNLTMIGYLAIGAVAFWVAAMAYLQINGLKRISAA